MSSKPTEYYCHDQPDHACPEGQRWNDNEQIVAVRAAGLAIATSDDLVTLASSVSAAFGLYSPVASISWHGVKLSGQSQ